jgi:hypothetical protein
MAMKKPRMKKLTAVRLAVKTLGLNVPPKEVSQWVKNNYNIDLTPATASNYVTTARKELRAGNGTPAEVERPKAAAAPSQVRATPILARNGVPIEQVVQAVTTLKGLVGKLGKGNVLKLVEAL